MGLTGDLLVELVDELLLGGCDEVLATAYTKILAAIHVHFDEVDEAAMVLHIHLAQSTYHASGMTHEGRVPECRTFGKLS